MRFGKSKNPDVFYNVRWSTTVNRSTTMRETHVKTCIGNRVIRDGAGLTILRADGTVSGSWEAGLQVTAVQVDNE